MRKLFRSMLVIVPLVILMSLGGPAIAATSSAKVYTNGTLAAQAYFNRSTPGPGPLRSTRSFR